MIYSTRGLASPLMTIGPDDEVRAIIGKSSLKESILFLESEPVIRKVICKALESAGYFVLSAGDLGRAMELLKEFTPDLFMVRHFIEEMPGRIARARTPLPIECERGSRCQSVAWTVRSASISNW